MNWIGEKNNMAIISSVKFPTNHHALFYCLHVVCVCVYRSYMPGNLLPIFVHMCVYSLVCVYVCVIKNRGREIKVVMRVCVCVCVCVCV